MDTRSILHVDQNDENLVTFLSAPGGKTALNLTNGSDTDSYIIRQCSKASRTNSERQTRQSKNINIANNQEAESSDAADININDIASAINHQILSGATSLTGAQIRMLDHINREGDTPLSIAARCGKKDNVDLFIRCGIDVNHRNIHGKSAADLAWENDHYDSLLILLKADSDFPKHFNISALKREYAQKKLKKFVVARNNFHLSIKKNNLNDIKRYVKTIIGSKFYINSAGQSAMFTAIEFKRFEILLFLKSNGFAFKNEKEEEECLNKLSQEEKDMLKKKLISTFPQIDQAHILYLTSKSRSKESVDKERIEKLYRSLDAIPEVSIILKVLQCIDCLEIVFDFDKSLEDINSNAPEASIGANDYEDGRIHIAAKIEENRLLGILAHELTHLAMYNLYKNNCNPFENSKNAKRNLFAKITAKIEEYTKDTVQMINSDTEDSPLITMARAFTYPKNEQQSKLIARISYILAQYHDEGRKWLLDTNEEIKSLFDYYIDDAEGGIAYRCKEFIANSFLMKPRSNIEVINDYIGEINNVVKYWICFKSPIPINNFLESKKQVFLLKTENTFLSILNMYENISSQNRDYSMQDSLFTTFNSYIEKRDVINDLFLSTPCKILCIRYTNDSNNEQLLDVLKILNTLLEEKSDKKIIFIVFESQVKEFDEIKSVFNQKCYKEAIECKLTLNDLVANSQLKLLKREIIFQGEITSLNELIGKLDKNVRKAITAEMLEILITYQVIKIGSRPLGIVGLEGAYSVLAEEVNMETFVDKLLSEESDDIYIISGIPEVVKTDKLIEYLVNADIDINKRSKVNDFKSEIAVFKQDTTRTINNRIQIASDQFKTSDFKRICYHNRESKVYWIILKHEDGVSKFVLEQIYNPDFYVKCNRFNNKVVIENNIKDELAGSTLSEIFIIGGKTKDEFARWLHLCDEKEQMEFERNYNQHRIKILNPQVNMLATFQELVDNKRNQTYHLLKFEQDQLIWCKTHGSLVNLSQYRRKYKNETKYLIGEDALITEIKDEKMVILAGCSGVGKTSTLVKLYELNYASEPDAEESIIQSHWLITVNLKDHLDTIRAIDFNVSATKNIIDFLSQVDKSISDVFSRQLLAMALRQQGFGKPLLIEFVGLDEILNETDKDKVISLLRCIKDKTEAKCWITTSLHYQKTLEKTLSTFAVKCDSMDDETANEFIKKYLKNNLSLILRDEEFQSIFGNSENIIKNTRMQKYIEKFLSKMHEVFKHDRVIGKPLQLYLMLEGTARYFKEWAQDVNDPSPDFSYLGNDLWEVYENFIDRKFRIYFEKTKIKEQSIRQKYKITFNNYHRIVIRSFITKSARSVQSLETLRDVLMLGGIIKSDSSTFEFIHPTFRDYFAAKEFLSWTIAWKSEETSINNEEYLLQKISVNPEYRVMRAFLNCKFLKLKMTNLYVQEDYYDENVLFVAVREDNIGIIRFVLDNSDNQCNVVDIRNKYERTILHMAAFHSNLELVKLLVEEKFADFNAKDIDGMSVLHTAATYGNLDIVKYLINENGADYETKNDQGATILHMAAEAGNLEIVKFLINEKKFNFRTRDDYGSPVFHAAVNSGNLELVKFLANEKRVNIECRDNFSLTVLHVVANTGNMDITKFLINEKGANFNAKDVDGMTVLHTAAFFGNLEMVKFLIIEKDADHEDRNIYGATVLHTAADSGKMGIVEYLLTEIDADLTVKDNNGVSVFQAAVNSGNLELIKYLADEDDVDFAALDNSGRTVVHVAANLGNVEIVEFLVDETGADFNASDLKGSSALHIAAGRGNLDVVKYLINKKKAGFRGRNIEGMTILHSAVNSGSLETVKFLVDEKKIDVEVREKGGMTSLHMAANSRNFEIVKYLINEKKADIHARASNARSLLHTAARFGNIEMVKYLIDEKDFDIEDEDASGMTALQNAIVIDNFEMIKYLVNEKGADVSAKDKFGTTILQTAAILGDLEVVKFLINENGVDYNVVNDYGVSPLHSAVDYGNLDVVKFLINEFDMDLTIEDNFGVTIFHAAANSGNFEVVKFLVNEKHVDFESIDDCGMSILHTAANSGNLWLVKYLINEKGADITARDNEGMTVLHAAVTYANLEMVKFLVNEKNADFEAVDNYGMTVLHTAAAYGNLEMVKFLIDEKGADYERINNYGAPIVHRAAAIGNVNIVKYLIEEKKVDIETTDQDGMTILHQAAKSGRLDLIKYLVDEIGLNMNRTDNRGRTILHIAATFGYLDVVEYLITEKGFHVDARKHNGTSPGM